MSADLRRRPGGLGRGLSALLGEANLSEAEEQTGSAAELIPVGRLMPHPEQPRRRFQEEALDELAKSIAARGLLQPILVRRQGADYQIIAGERRWRAAQRAGLLSVPVIVKDFDEAETLEIALVENIQREDLNAIEEAEAYRRLIHEFGHTQEALGRIVHKSRSHIANLLRLLDLPASIREAVAEGTLSMGHARAIAGAADPAALADEVIAKGLSVREAESLARKVRTPPRDRRPIETKAAPDGDIQALERQLGDLLGLRVRIAHRGQQGEVTISYGSLDQLDLICQRLSAEGI